MTDGTWVPFADSTTQPAKPETAILDMMEAEMLERNQPTDSTGIRLRSDSPMAQFYVDRPQHEPE